LRFHEGEDLTLLTSSKDEKVNSKKPLPSEMTPHLYRSFQIRDSFAFKATTDNGVEPFGQRILPWRLCFHATKPTS
jgi:hypothetical protein